MESQSVQVNNPDTSRQPAILAENVSKSYGGFRLLRSKIPLKYALREVSFSLYPGETLGLLGPNGAGKTTLLKIIATLLSPTTGRVLLSGHDVATDSIAARRNLGLVTSDERSFYWRLTGRQNLMFFAALYEIPKALAEKRIEVLLDVLGLSHAADERFLGYSSGMKQKLAIARGLMNKPNVVLYDEPTRALDPLSAQGIRRWIQDNQSRSPEQAHLLATNQLYEAEQLCHRVMIINRGTIIALGTIDQIREDWRRYDFAIHHITCKGPMGRAMLHPMPEIGLLDVTIESTERDVTAVKVRTLKDSEALHLILADIIEAGGKIVGCESEETSFDDIFCALVAGDRVAPAGASL